MARRPARRDAAALVAVFTGGVAAVSTLANYAEGTFLRTFLVLTAAALGSIATYVTLPLAEPLTKKILS
jgi:hypothetical protein